MKHKKLILFTATFPFGQAETFLEDEILFLSQVFEKVIIVPFSPQNAIERSTPGNCTITEPVVRNRWIQYIKGLFVPLSLGLFFKDFFKSKVYTDINRLKAWLIAYILTNNYLSSKTIRDVFKIIDSNDVCYFYWGKGANVLAYSYKGKAVFVSRFHGEWDLWEESSGNYAPVRCQIANSLDAAVFISEKGKKYYEERYGGGKTFFFPLGSTDIGFQDRKKVRELRIISCSTVYPLKRVPLIFEALKKVKGYEINWTHIGGGNDWESLKRQVECTCPSNINVNLLGEMSHNDVMDYYKEHQFDIFVNVSTNEGVPVSIMEAISFNIPVVATNVGGNSEVVTKESGYLVSDNPTPEELADAIVSLYNTECTPRAFWESHYSAKVNYASFANFLNNI